MDSRVEEYDYGKFGWIMDPDGNRIELWEPLPKKDTPNNLRELLLEEVLVR